MSIEAKLPTGEQITHFPFEAPWMTPYGMGLINIAALRRRDDGEIEAQLADEAGKPYEDGNAWTLLSAFPREWPD